MVSHLHTWFPTTTSPFICNAPMFGYAKARLAASVTEAGGLGFIGGGFDFTATSAHITTLRSELSSARELLQIQSPQDILPIGIGFLMFSPENFLGGIIPLLHDYRPAAVWLFAAENRTQYAEVIPSLKSEGRAWGLKIFVQVGSVMGAREAVEDGADILVVQGTDAGGHQMAHGASLMTLLPEVVDMLNDEFQDSHVSVMAAGGVMDGRGIAAAIALGLYTPAHTLHPFELFARIREPANAVEGAHGAAMGTRFLATPECTSPEVVKEIVVSTNDGSQSTIKSTIHDIIQGRDIWPATMDGRAIIGDSYKDFISGLPEEENMAKYKKAEEVGDISRKIVFAGAGVGLVRAIVSAEEVVKGSQTQALKIFLNMEAS